MKYSTNYGLREPDYTDDEDVADIVYNMDLIDAELFKRSQQSKTYSQLATMIANNALVPGAQYLLSDYATKYQQPDTLVIKTMSTENLILTAISTNKFSPVCSSLDYPQDIIYYRFDLNVCEDGTTARNGFIVRRIDESPTVCIDAPLDWRKIVWARYLPNQTQYLVGTVLTTYATWTSGAAALNVVYKSGNTLYMAKNTNTPTSATDPNVFSVVYPDITVGMLRADLKIGSTGTQDIILQKSTSYVEYVTFGSGCSGISLKECKASTLFNTVFGSSCTNNTFGSGCYNNTFGSSCCDNTFGSSCYNNIFGNACSGNTFAGNCYGNAFGNNKSNLTVNYMVGKSVVSTVDLESRNYTTTIDKNSNGMFSYCSLSATNTLAYTTIM